MPARIMSHRSCCNCCHIKHGTALMGFAELIVAAFLLFFTVDRLIKKSVTKGQCFSAFFATCQFNVSISKLDMTLTADYISAALMFLVLTAVMLLFYGIATSNASWLLPHLVIQALCLAFSLLYFFLYAWTYFYEDLYINKRPFRFWSFFERMWLVSIFLLLAIFQFYLFFIVVNCAVYLQNTKAERVRRQRLYDEAFNDTTTKQPTVKKNDTALTKGTESPTNKSLRSTGGSVQKSSGSVKSSTDTTSIGSVPVKKQSQESKPFYAKRPPPLVHYPTAPSPPKSPTNKKLHFQTFQAEAVGEQTKARPQLIKQKSLDTAVHFCPSPTLIPSESSTVSPNLQSKTPLSAVIQPQPALHHYSLHHHHHHKNTDSSVN